MYFWEVVVGKIKFLAWKLLYKKSGFGLGVLGGGHTPRLKLCAGKMILPTTISPKGKNVQILFSVKNIKNFRSCLLWLQIPFWAHEPGE